jgi:hypothetical protein
MYDRPASDQVLDADDEMSRHSLVKAHTPVSPLGPYYRGPLPLDAFIVVVEIRKAPEDGFEDPPRQSYPVPVSLLVDDEFDFLPSKKLRASHLSYELFGNWIEKIFGIYFTKADCELGWRTSSLVDGIREEYYTISSPAAFHNAISVMHNASGEFELPRKLVFYLWSPVPAEPVFRRSARAPEHPRVHQKLPQPSQEQPDELEPGPDKTKRRRGSPEGPLDNLDDEEGTLFNTTTAMKNAVPEKMDEPVREEGESDADFRARWNLWQEYLEELKAMQ